jgi:hypothetical protein
MWLNERLTRIDEKLHAGVGGGEVASNMITPPQRAISNSPTLMGFSTPLPGHSGGVGTGGGDDRLVDISPVAVAVPQINVIASSPPAVGAPASLALQRRAGGVVSMQMDIEQLTVPTPAGVNVDDSADVDDMNSSMDDESSVSDAGSQRSVGGRPMLRREYAWGHMIVITNNLCRSGWWCARSVARQRVDAFAISWPRYNRCARRG